MANKREDRSVWAIGGTTIIGVGVGFIFIQSSPMLFIASVLIGVGLGLVIVPMISRYKEQD